MKKNRISVVGVLKKGSLFIAGLYVFAPMTSFAQSTDEQLSGVSTSGTVNAQASSGLSGFTADVKMIVLLAAFAALGVAFMALQANKKQVARIQAQE